MPASEQNKALKGQGLPVVSAKTLDAIFQVYAGKKWSSNLEKVRERLISENPHLVRFIESQVGKYPRELHNPIFEVVIGVLSVLEHQAMVDNKEKS